MERINLARAAGRSCGSTLFGAVAPLRWNTALFKAAAGHSGDMASKNFFSHTGSDGSIFTQRIYTAGYAGSALAENIAAGQGSVDAVMQSWLNSPGHCANIMAAAYNDVGVSCVQSGTSTYGNYWTMDFGYAG